MKIDKKEYYSISEIAFILNEHECTVKNWIDYKLLPFVIDTNGIKKIPFVDFVKFLKVNSYNKVLQLLCKLKK